MSFFGDLQKKKPGELESSSAFSQARKSNRSSFFESQGNILDEEEEESSASAAGGRALAVNTLPIIGGILAGAKTGAALGTLGAGPIGTVVGAIGGGITGGIITKFAQDKVLEVVKGDEWKRNLDQTLAEDRAEHPYATFIGGEAPQLLFFKPSPTTLKQAFSLSKRVFSDPKSLAKHGNTLQGKTELDALINVGIGSGVDVSLETYQQAREGDLSAIRILSAAVIGGTLSNPTKLGVKIGFNPSGDAVIEEFDKFGSKTPAARVVTHGDVPILDRSTDPVLLQRKELASILRGEGEQNRFDNPRILKAEQIAGTIDKNVTADSQINVYRLDGRSGNLRVGERVTANPHIADVFGGRINPETTVRAGDMVRTSQGDYIYIPKEDIVSRPKLPPVPLTVDKKVRQQVKSREKIAVKEKKARGKEAIRIKEEPARLQKEAEAKALKIQKEADELVVKQEKDKTRLEQEVKNIKTREQSDLNAEKTRVANEKKKVAEEKKVIRAKLDKAIEKAGDTLRKNLAEAKLGHVKRKEKLNTKLQKAKEDIRFTNEKARIKAKDSKAKKALKDKSTKEEGKIKDDSTDTSKEIKTQALKSVIATKKEITSLKAETIKTKIQRKTSVKKTADKIPATKITSTKTVEVKPAKEKTTLIGTQTVKSKSIIKNAIEEAKDNSDKAQFLDENITTQQGTTFVEQRKLSAELLAKKGFDETIRFANEATDIELNKLGINRSALYEILYKTAVKEGQFNKFHDELEALAFIVADEVSEAAQKSSLHRLATQNDPFRRVAKMKKDLIEIEKKARGTVFTKEVDELHAKIKEAGTEADVNKIINDNLC